MNLRRRMFFLLDKKKLVTKQLEEIKKANENDEYAYNLHKECISKLISHVNQTVPFYKKLAIINFKDLPVVNKVMMKENITNFLSTADLKIAKIRHTSGSTGIPFKIRQDLYKAKRVQAELVYYREITGNQLGTKFINLLSPSRLDSISKLSTFKQNVICFDVSKMDVNTLEELHSLLQRNHHIYYMLGYASALEKIANYFLEKGYNEDYSITSIVSSSEILTEGVRKKLSKVFNCLIYDRYSNEDNGFIAQTDGVTHDFFVNRASYFVEILKLDSNETAAENELGRIVVTDYFNYAQPFLRYDTGDLGSYSYKMLNGAKRLVLTTVAGRISDVVFDLEDRPISTFAIGCALELFSNIQQYQLIQDSRENFTLNIIDSQKYYSFDEYKDALETVVGKGINLNLCYLDQLPVLNSGKFKRVICNYTPKKTI